LHRFSRPTMFTRHGRPVQSVSIAKAWKGSEGIELVRLQ